MIRKIIGKVGFVVTLFLLHVGNSLLAQDLTIKGIVKDNKTSEALIGVKVQVKGSNVATGTNADGKFTISVPSTGGTLVFSLADYKANEKKVTASNENLEVRLLTDVYKMSDVVVVGIGSSLKREDAATSVGLIKADEITSTTSQTVAQAFSGKIAGLSIIQNSGAPGGGINVNLRGTTTLNGSTQPMYIVDGIVYASDEVQGGSDAVTAAGGVGSVSPQGQPSSRISDLNPNDIASLEVLKGPSAAAIYGSRAASGVIIITTKSGVPTEKPQVDVSQTSGFSTVLKKLNLNFNADGNEGTAPSTTSTKNSYVDYENALYGRTAYTNETSVSIKGGTKTTLLYGGVTAKYEDGIMINTNYQRYSAKVGISQFFGDKVNVDANVSYTYSKANKGVTGNGNNGVSTTYNLAYLNGSQFGAKDGMSDLTKATNGVYPAGPGATSGGNPYEEALRVTNEEITNRVSAASKITWNIYKDDIQNLKVTADGGADYFYFQNLFISPYNTNAEIANSALAGRHVMASTSSLTTSAFVSLVHSIVVNNDFKFTTSAGFVNETKESVAMLADVQGTITTIPNVNFASSTANLRQTTNKLYTLGFYAQEQISIMNGLNVTGAIRADRTSASGNSYQLYVYPNAQVALVLSNFEFWEAAGLNSVIDLAKIRAAYGQAGTHPQPYMKYASLLQSNISGAVGSVVPSVLGDPNIRPERAHEVEAGIDLGFLNIFSIEGTVFYKVVEDLIISQQLATSSGSQTLYKNGGTMTNWGVELSLGVQWYRDADWSIRTDINYAMSRAMITDLAVPAYTQGGFGTTYGTYLLAKNYSPTTIVGRFGSSTAEPNKVLAQNMIYSKNGVLSGDNTGTATYGIYGDANPLFRMGLGSSIKWKGLEFRFLFDWKYGGQVINVQKTNSSFATGGGGTNPSAQEPNNMKFPDGTPITSSATAILSAAYYPFFTVEDGSYLKLREVALSYTFVKPLDGISYIKIGVSGRNLLMFTAYTGYDPEVSNFGSVAIGGGIDVGPYPSSRSVNFNLSFGL